MIFACTSQASDALKLKNCRDDGKVDYKSFLFLAREVLVHDRPFLFDELFASWFARTCYGLMHNCPLLSDDFCIF